MFFQIYLYFGIILTLFALLIGMIFMNLYQDSIMDSYKEQLFAQAERISDQMSQLVMEEDKEGSLIYMDYLESLEGSETTDIWFLANEKAKKPMEREFTNVDIDDVPLIPEMERVIKRALKGKKAYSTGYDNIYEKVMMRVGAPIFDTKGNVVGIVLLNSFVDSKKSVIESSRLLILYSIVGGLLISFIIALLFANLLSKPISKMRVVALELANGNYKKRANVKRRNEIGVLAQSIDILAERLQENEIERNNMEQMRMDFFANVSHELRTPITVMRGYSETLADGIVTKEEKKQQYYTRMIAECKSMENLVGDLLILSKMQNPDFVIEKEPVNLIQIFSDLYRSVKTMSQEKNIMIEIEQNAACAMMLGDYERLRQLFLIILDNAIKFSSENKKVHINIVVQDKLLVEIQDEGIGISQEELPYIFEKFYKSKLRQNAKGSGLGLMIAKQIVSKHEGEIAVESEVGVGTKFIVTFQKLEVENQEFGVYL